MPPAALQRCLHGMTPEQWYELLNGKVFFWTDAKRLNRHLHACRRNPQVVMVLDAERLLASHGARTAVSPFNTGYAGRRPASRGAATFVPYATWRQSGWAHEAAALCTRPRPRSHSPAELAVDRAVPDALSFVVEVRHLAVGQELSFSSP
jgi:hypothetical protein